MSIVMIMMVVVVMVIEVSAVMLGPFPSLQIIQSECEYLISVA